MAASYRPYLRVTWSDSDSSATGYAVVDRLVAGMATGGLRMRPGCTLAEVEDLAREMTLKTACYRIPVGGAKGGIDYPADAPDADAVRERYVLAMRPMLDSIWTTAGDLGTPQDRLDAVFTRLGLGPSSLRAGLLRSPDPERSQEHVRRMFALVDDGLSMPSLIGGYGVAQAGLAGLEVLGIEADGARSVVQGFGAMGGSSALYLHRAGVLVVAVADALGVVANPAGLDVPDLLARRSTSGVVDREGLGPADAELPGKAWIDIESELTVPAASSYCVTDQNADRLRTRLVVEAANVPVTAAAEERLGRRGIPVVPDFVANAGAAAWAWWAVFGLVTDADDSRAMVARHVRPLVHAAMDPWLADQTPPRATATAIAWQHKAELTDRFGEVSESIPLFEAGALAAKDAHSTRPDSRRAG